MASAAKCASCTRLALASPLRKSRPSTARWFAPGTGIPYGRAVQRRQAATMDAGSRKARWLVVIRMKANSEAHDNATGAMPWRRSSGQVRARSYCRMRGGTGIDQQVRIDQDHGWSSPSRIARTLPTLSKEGRRHSPNRALGFGNGAPAPASPSLLADHGGVLHSPGS